MANVYADRAKETTATTGTGTLTLAGAVAGFQSFAAIGNGNTGDYCLLSGNGVDWETGNGTYTASGTTWARTTVYASSNAGALISLSGTSTVFIALPAKRLGFIGCRVYNDGTQSIGNNSSTIVTFNTEEFDTSGIHDTSSNTGRLTIPAGLGGKWRLSWKTTWAANASTTTARNSFISKNGSATPVIGTSTFKSGTANLARSDAGSVIVNAAAADYFEMLFYQNTGGSLLIGEAVATDAGKASAFECEFLGA